MIYENTRDRKDGIFIALSEGKTSHAVSSHLWIFFFGGGEY